MIRIHRSDKNCEVNGSFALNKLVLALRKVDLNCTLELRYVGVFGVGVNLVQGGYSEAINFSWSDISVRNESKVESRFITYLEKIKWQENNQS